MNINKPLDFITCFRFRMGAPKHAALIAYDVRSHPFLLKQGAITLGADPAQSVAAGLPDRELRRQPAAVCSTE